MSEDLTYCVRGCVQPCRCDECAASDRPVHAPISRRATDGYLCRGCADRLRMWIAEIPDLYATLDLYEAPATEDAGRLHSAAVSGSPALIRLDVLALQDPRTSASMIPYPGAEPIPWDGRLYVPDEIGTWALLLAEEHHIDAPIGTLYQAAGLLTRHFDALAASPWVDECYDAMRDIARLLKTAHGVERPQAIGRCTNVYERDGKTITCRASIYAGEAGSKARCQSCGQRYDGQQAMLARIQTERDDREAGSGPSDAAPSDSSRRRVRRKAGHDPAVGETRLSASAS